MKNIVETEEPKQQPRCVLRSLESITGAKATPEEEAYRMRQRATQQETFTPLFNEQEVTLDTYIKALEAESAHVRELVEHIMNSDSPLGLALKQYSMNEQDLYPKRVAELLAKGYQIIWLTVNHAAHVGQDPQGSSFISLSDGHAKASPTVHHTMHVMIFTPKG